MGKIQIFEVKEEGNLHPFLGKGYDSTADALKHLRTAGKPGNIYVTGLMGGQVQIATRQICVPIGSKPPSGKE
jgi:hypothetical protein